MSEKRTLQQKSPAKMPGLFLFLPGWEFAAAAYLRSWSGPGCDRALTEPGSLWQSLLLRERSEPVQPTSGE